MARRRWEDRSHHNWPIAEVLRRFGWNGKESRHGKWREIHCPFHDDRNKSAGYNPSDNIFRCQACDAKGNSVTLVMQQEGMSEREAVRWLEAQVGSRGLSFSTQPDSMLEDNRFATGRYPLPPRFKDFGP